MTDLLTLAQAGPVAILLVGIALMTRAFLTGAAVPGWLYKQEREQRIKAEERADQSAESLAVIAKKIVAVNGKPVAADPPADG